MQPLHSPLTLCSPFSAPPFPNPTATMGKLPQEALSHPPLGNLPAAGQELCTWLQSKPGPGLGVSMVPHPHAPHPLHPFLRSRLVQNSGRKLPLCPQHHPRASGALEGLKEALDGSTAQSLCCPRQSQGHCHVREMSWGPTAATSLRRGVLFHLAQGTRGVRAEKLLCSPSPTPGEASRSCQGPPSSELHKAATP